MASGPIQFSSAAQSCLTLCDPKNCSTPGLPVHQQLPKFTQTHVHRVSDAIQPSHPLSSPSPPAPYPSQHQSLFQWVNSSHEVAKVLEFQVQHHSLQRNPRANLLRANRRCKGESSNRFPLLGLQSHCELWLNEIRWLLLGRKVMSNLDSVLKSRDITLSTKVHIVKAMVFPVVMYGCESWTIKKAEHQRINGFEL